MNEKLLSGRYFITVVAALVFAYMSVTKLLSEQFVSDIIKMIVMFYFLKGVK